MSDTVINSQLDESIASKFPILASIGLAALMSTGDVGAANLKKSSPPRTESGLVRFDGNIADIIKSFENNKNYPKGGYNKANGKWYPYVDVNGRSIAYGHYITPAEESSGIYKNGITDEQASDLLKQDIKKKLSFILSFLPDYNRYPNEIKNAILVAVYRGDLLPNHKTAKYIKRGDFASASIEFLNNEDYRTGNNGIRSRLTSIARTLFNYSEQLKSLKEIDFSNSKLGKLFKNNISKYDSEAGMGDAEEHALLKELVISTQKLIVYIDEFKNLADIRSVIENIIKLLNSTDYNKSRGYLCGHILHILELMKNACSNKNEVAIRKFLSNALPQYLNNMEKLITSAL